MKQSTTKRPSSATNLQEEQRDGAMKEASTYLVRAHQRQLPRSRLNDTPDLPLERIYYKRTYSEVCADLNRVDLHDSHNIMRYRGIWFCASCGAYTDGLRKQAVRKLCRPCKPAGRGGKLRLGRLALGKHPELKPWPAELNRHPSIHESCTRRRVDSRKTKAGELNRHRIESASPWPAPLQRNRLMCKTRPELDEIARELVLAGQACPRGVRPASPNAAASSSRQVAVAAYGAAAVAPYKCGAVAPYKCGAVASLNDAAASNSEVPRLRLSDSDPETQQLIRETQQSGLARLYQGKQPLRHPAGGVGVRLPEPHALVVIAAPKLRRSCADENGCGRCFCDTCYQL